MTTAAVPSIAPPARELDGLTAALERRLLVALAGKVPARIGPDHLTLLGFAAMLLAGVAYALSSRWPVLLLAVNVALALNWLGDSLDGTLARHRRRTRPRYGFYVDHVVDAFGAVFLLLGLAASGWVTPALAVALLLAYLLLCVNIALAASSRGIFKISYGALGGTELRILLAAANAAAWAWPRVSLAGATVLSFDLVAGAGLAGVTAVLLRSVWQNTRALYDLERL
ncbi:MAG TPA: CDP-alcohol phosphatidyltransferase family protein [Vicinamibacteria bacterium]|nr:CDP-alcohol phosphatidyltransferase family protein [Vicinamibacteria bacterium]